MSSKRQQARNERALQELIKTIPGNDTCADCQARNPGWSASASVAHFAEADVFDGRMGKLERTFSRDASICRRVRPAPMPPMMVR